MSSVLGMMASGGSQSLPPHQPLVLALYASRIPYPDKAKGKVVTEHTKATGVTHVATAHPGQDADIPGIP
jgi:hypothetical protein